MKKLITIFLLASLSMYGCSTSSPESSDVQPISSSTVSSESSSEPIPSPSESSTISSEPEDSSSESSSTQEADSDNPLINTSLVEIPVMNGTKTEKIGTAAYIVSDKSLITEQYLAEFAENRVAGSGFNWVFIKFPDDTGIFFPGAIAEFASYGTIGEDKSLGETLGDIVIKDGKCTYTPAS